MKKIALLAVIAFGFASCGNNDATTNIDSTATPPPADKTEVAANTNATPAVLDPICKMEKNSEWTEYSVKNADTTWFCSPHCKETFDKDPAKYAVK